MGKTNRHGKYYPLLFGKNEYLRFISYLEQLKEMKEKQLNRRVTKVEILKTIIFEGLIKHLADGGEHLKFKNK